MHPNPAFHIRDVSVMRAIVEEQGFGMLLGNTEEGLRVAHVPVILASDERLEFHLARSNRLAGIADGSDALFVCNGPHGYISPDWYGLPDQVPTWNYQAVEVQGSISRLPDAALPDLLERLSGMHEQRLSPKPVWHHDKMGSGIFARMLKGIIGFSIDIREWRGTAKLGQNKSVQTRINAAAGLRQTGNAQLADVMESLAL